MPVIGFLSGRSLGESTELIAAFRQGLSEAGYVEGRSVLLEYQWTQGQYDRLPALASDLVARRVAVIVTTGGTPQQLSLTGLPALAKIANRRRAGTTSRKSSSRLPARSVCWNDRPVTLPPGRARLTTKPVPTGSPPAKTIGMTDVACFAARTLTVPPETITSTFCRTNSATISAARSLRPSAHRTLIAAARPSIQLLAHRMGRASEAAQAARCA